MAKSLKFAEGENAKLLDHGACRRLGIPFGAPVVMGKYDPSVKKYVITHGDTQLNLPASKFIKIKSSVN